jgi:peptidoglycan/xylan/chitin deacetylase (PgdA/CDA1 family)
MISKKKRVVVGAAIVALVLVSSFLLVYYLQNLTPGISGPHTTYVVKAGDTLYDIGIRFGVPWELIAQANHLSPPYDLRASEVLIIPLEDPSCASAADDAGSVPYGAVTYTTTGGNYTGPGRRYVMIRFDDSYQDQWVNALPILAKYGYRASFATVAGLLLNITECGLSTPWVKMNWNEVLWLYGSGNEITDHTMTHAHLNNQSWAELEYQINGSKILLEKYGITRDPALTLPFGQGVWNQTVMSYISEVGFKYVYPDEQVNGTGILGYNYTGITTQWYSIDSLDNQSLARFEYLAERASSSNVVGFIFHHVADHVTDTGYYVNMTNFEQDMAYLNASGYTIILPSQLPGFEVG